MKTDFYKYIPHGEDDELWGLYINVSGKATIAPNTVYPPYGHPSGYYFHWHRGRTLKEYQINYVTEGSGVFETRDAVTPVKAGSIIIIRPDVWHRYRPDIDLGWTEHYIGFNGDWAHRLFKHPVFDRNNDVIHIGFNDRIITGFLRIIDEIKEEKLGYQHVCAGLLTEILGLTISALKNKDFSGKDIEVKIRKACVILRERITENIDIQQLADELNLGYSYFRKMFKEINGISPAQYHLMLRLEKARELLVTTDKSVKEIAIILGFQSIFYFSRIFKKKMGLIPTDLRKNW